MTDTLAWQDQAVCRGVNGFTELDPLTQMQSCRECPVQFQCLEFAVAHHPVADKSHIGGVYGGKAPEDLAVLIKSRRRAAAYRRFRGRSRQGATA